MQIAALLSDHDLWIAHNQRMSTDDEPDTAKPLDPLAVEIGRRIAIARGKMSQRELCEELKMGVNNTRLSNYERGIRMAPVAVVKRIAEIRKVPAAWLLTLTDDPELEKEVRRLADLYAHSDKRGRETIFRVAEQESHYGAESLPDCKRAS